MQRLKNILRAVFGYKRMLILLLIPVALALVTVAQSSAAFSEWYAMNVYKYISLFWNFISSLVPISVAEIIVILLIPALIFYFVFTIIRIVKKKNNRGKTAYKSFLNVLCAISIVFFLFISNFGICYYRYTFADVSGIEVRDSSVEELYELCVKLAKNSSELRGKLSEENGIMTLSGGIDEAKKQTQGAMNDICEKYPTVTGGYSAVKSVMLSRLMSHTRITGIFFPFTFEANVNVDAPEFSIPSTMCHELAHLRGYAREDEANFIAYLACINSDSDELKYSGYMLAFVHAGNELYSADQDKYAEACGYLSDGVISDMRYNTEYWSQFETPIATAASSINDSYLKANSQEDGTKSYGRMVDLLLAYERAV